MIPVMESLASLGPRWATFESHKRECVCAGGSHRGCVFETGKVCVEFRNKHVWVSSKKDDKKKMMRQSLVKAVVLCLSVLKGAFERCKETVLHV